MDVCSTTCPTLVSDPVQPTEPCSAGSDVGAPSDLSLRGALNYLRFCGFISKPPFCSCNPFQAKGGAQITRKSLDFLALGGSWGEQEPPRLPGVQLGGRFCTPSLHTGCKPLLTAAPVFTEWEGRSIKPFKLLTFFKPNITNRNSPPFVFTIKIMYFHITPLNYTQSVCKIYWIELWNM